jgi:RHS repeat-associated protein
MGYSLTTSFDLPSTRPHASPKMHVPGSRLQERGLRYYSTELSRWINRDPIDEQDSLNVCAFVRNAPVDRIDYLGLSTISYEVLVGSPIVGVFGSAGSWGQPWWTADGDSGDNWSEVTVRSRRGSGGSCNTVNTWTRPAGDAAGQIRVLFKTDCAGVHKLKITVTMIAEGAGQIGYARVRYTDKGGNNFTRTGTTDAPYAETRVYPIVFSINDADVNQNIEVAKYLPTIAFPSRSDANSGTAFGLLEAVEE